MLKAMLNSKKTQLEKEKTEKQNTYGYLFT